MNKLIIGLGVTSFLTGAASIALLAMSRTGDSRRWVDDEEDEIARVDACAPGNLEDSEMSTSSQPEPTPH